MENLLIMGINTRPQVNSALKLNYKTFSVSYFKTLDFKEPFAEKHILNQKSIDSCGFFENNYSSDKLLELSKEFLYNLTQTYKTNKNPINRLNEYPVNRLNESEENNEINKIVLTTGINANDFQRNFSKFKTKIRGNIKTEKIDNKFKFYKKLRNKFNLPLTFKSNDIYELIEIIKQYDNNQFILKPNKGSGGLGIILLNKNRINELNNIKELFENIPHTEYILQEHIEGTNVSSSVLSNKKDRKNLINSRLITEKDLGNDSYRYSGNIIPLDYYSLKSFKKNNSKSDEKSITQINKNLKEVSEDLIKEFKLIGSNGVDFIINNDELKIIEINPRLQGTYELCEEVMDINLLDAHIKACEGELIEIPEVKKYAIKKIIYAKKQVLVGDLNIKNILDIPYPNVKIEKDQPLVTLVNSDKNLSNAIKNITISEKIVANNID